MTAALIHGTRTLAPSAGEDIRVLVAATGIHLGLSVLYATLALPLARRLTWATALPWGVLFGTFLYFLNLYALTGLFPWFAVARGPVTWAAHVVFGLSVMIVLRGRDRALV